MNLTNDENEFFRQATLKICGHVEIENALTSLIQFLQNSIPVSQICIELYDENLSSMRTIAMASREKGQSLDILTPISKDAYIILNKMYQQFPKNVFIINNASQNPLACELLKFFRFKNDSALLLILFSNQQPLGGVILLPYENTKFTEEHAKLLSLLKEPFTIAMSNAIKHHELLKLKENLTDDNHYLRGELRRLSGDSIIGSNFGLKDVMDNVRQVAQLDSPVLLLGETGVGKDVIANAIHYLSERSEAPFIAVNCGAIPDSLIDSELFGHEKGAFTGAITQKRGRFERADGGTIFLDEIGELPLQAQVRLLRVLQDKKIERVGGLNTISLDIRIIAATNRNLEEMIITNKFREDLWFRLNVFPIKIPPLRDRKSDIPAMLQYFISKKSKELKLPVIPDIQPGAMQDLMNYSWPGNVRELQNIVERALILNPKGPLTFEKMLSVFNSDNENKINLIEEKEEIVVLDIAMSQHIKKALSITKGKIHGPGGAAELLKINPSTLRYRIKKLGITTEK